MLVRIRSKDGNFRFDLAPTTDISELVSKIIETASDPDLSTTLQALGFKHGDLFFVSYKSNPAQDTSGGATTTTSAPTTHDSSKRSWDAVVEDSVDQYWRKQDGKIRAGATHASANTARMRCATTACHSNRTTRAITPNTVSNTSPTMPTSTGSRPTRPPPQQQLAPPQPRPSPAHAALVPREGPVPIRRAPAMAARDLHRVPDVRDHAAEPAVPYGGPP
ncbi:hypothetical protein A0H81_00415 [Grifola frondosa]|uniref:Uncharacterized protein n=1 Tax=Grifola frondosa TaxID=5627 RepID=A0A1C7MR07_GRIFR|nr:hypothetical protein A0H81_00415 [Grifola frondosa]